jgi:dihydroorotate dehydrogenase
LYKFFRSLLFMLDAEFSHRLVLNTLRFVYFIPGIGKLIRAITRSPNTGLETELMGIRFPNPVGIAAGLDKNGHYYRPLLDLGFGFVELGTVTPKPQRGNAPKRMFRLPRHRAIINRMGFPSVGVEHFARGLRRRGKPGVIGVNIGKNKTTTNEHAVDDYIAAFRSVYGLADYVAINISSPNTPHLRAFHQQDKLNDLLEPLKNEQEMLGKTRRVYMPIALKVSPDLNDEDIASIAKIAIEKRLDAIIATNTTISREGIEEELLASEPGGLSGQPLKQRSTEVIRKFYNHLQGKVPIIGVGGIENADDAWEKMVAGADLVQVYTGFIYEGPMLAKNICVGLSKRVQASGFDSLTAAVNQARTGIHLMR